VHVGFTTQPVPGSFEFDTSKRGNSNAGHEHYRGSGEQQDHVFTDDERKALIEYLKTL
jgi:hypothetical protein